MTFRPGDVSRDDHRALGRLISAAENWRDKYDEIFESIRGPGPPGSEFR